MSKKLQKTKLLNDPIDISLKKLFNIAKYNYF